MKIFKDLALKINLYCREGQASLITRAIKEKNSMSVVDKKPRGRPRKIPKVDEHGIDLYYNRKIGSTSEVLRKE